MTGEARQAGRPEGAFQPGPHRWMTIHPDPRKGPVDRTPPTGRLTVTPRLTRGNAAKWPRRSSKSPQHLAPSGRLPSSGPQSQARGGTPTSTSRPCSDLAGSASCPNPRLRCWRRSPASRTTCMLLNPASRQKAYVTLPRQQPAAGDRPSRVLTARPSAQELLRAVDRSLPTLTAADFDPNEVPYHLLDREKP